VLPIKGLALQATVKGTKYWKDEALNWFKFLHSDR